MSIVSRLLRKNMSPAQIAGFVISNFIGLAIVVAGLQLYLDVSPIWQDEDSFIKKDYLIVNKKVTSSNTLGADARISAAEVAELERQPWVRAIGKFTATDYRVAASLENGGRSMSTYMFFESIPNRFIDVSPSEWRYTPGDKNVPIIISKDYLTLYNFGFASSVGLPQISEQTMGSIPMRLRLSSEDGTETADFDGRIVGFSNRLNTILVPEAFMQWSNDQFGNGAKAAADPARLVIDVSSPGDVAIAQYLEDHDLESAGDKSASQASFLLNVVTGIVMAVGAVITVLSLFILMLSISLLMQKNRDKLHLLLQLGHPLGDVAAPYSRIILMSCTVALVLALATTWVFRTYYITSVEGLGGGGGSLWVAPLAGAVLTAVIVGCNVLAVRRKVTAAWRL